MQYLSTFDPHDLHILVRLDLDLPELNGSFDTTRMEDGFATLEYLWQKEAVHVTVIAHRGHHAEPTPEFSLKPIAELLFTELAKRPVFSQVPADDLRAWLEVKENLRFDPREEAGDLTFAEELAMNQDIFVNDAFATAHRSHASIVCLPQLLPTYFGLQFEKEMRVLERITQHPDHPFVFILGGAKLDTKLDLLESMSKTADTVLLGGKLASEARKRDYSSPNVLIADLTQDGFDISPEAAATFAHHIASAKLIVWNGPMGMFEDGEHMAGTRAVAEALQKSSAFKVIGGGDTEAALTILKIDENAFDHVSSGGGAMLEYLTKKTLPAIEAVKK